MKRLARLFRRRGHNLLDKRQRFAIQTIVLTVGILLTQLIWEDFRFIMVILLSFATYPLTIWSLTEDIKGTEWLLLFILPVFFTASLSLFYFLLPGRWFTRLTITLIFAIGMYAILLVENIYNVALARSIQLLRAAQSVGLLLTLVVVFLSSNIVYSLRLPFWMNLFVLGLICSVLAMQSLWSVKLEEKLTKPLYIYSFLVVGLGVGELALVLSFWPVPNASYSLLITASYYALVGIVQQYFLGRLFSNNIREYILVFVFSFILTYLTTKWG